MNRKTILFVHQSSELYGSDKTLFCLVRDLKNTNLYTPIVVLPHEGPLKDILRKENIKVIVAPVTKVSRKMFKIGNLLLLPFKLLKALRHLKKELKGETIDLIHSNTLAVLLGAFYAKQEKIKHLWHVHEIIEHPRAVNKTYSVFVDKFSDLVVYNSKASLDALCNKRTSLINKSQVIWNGLDREAPKTPNLEVSKIRKTLFKGYNLDTQYIGLVGRINRWKGHLLMLEAYHKVSKNHPNTKLIFIGSPPPNQEFFRDSVLHKIKELGIESHCEIVSFRENIWPLYDSLDIVVVPSTEPEPFGLVAIESMLSQKLVIAANHGGLREIIAHEKTGLLFVPNDVNDLALKLTKSIEEKEYSNQLAASGFQSVISDFCLEKYVSSFRKVYLEIESKQVKE